MPPYARIWGRLLLTLRYQNTRLYFRSLFALIPDDDWHRVDDYLCWDVASVELSILFGDILRVPRHMISALQVTSATPLDVRHAADSWLLYLRPA